MTSKNLKSAIWLILAVSATALAAGIHVVICDTRAHRTLASSQYGVRRAK